MFWRGHPPEPHPGEPPRINLKGEKTRRLSRGKKPGTMNEPIEAMRLRT